MLARANVQDVDFRIGPAGTKLGYFVNYPTRRRRRIWSSNKNRTCSFVNQLMTLYHGTNRLDFMRFDMSHVEPSNIGLHFGTRAAAENRNFQKFGDISEVNMV